MDPWIRASDNDRESTVAAMREQVGSGRLSLDEFSERSADAYRAHTVGDLAALTRDLPRPAAWTPTGTHPALIPALVILAALLVGGVLLAFAVAGIASTDQVGPMMGHMGSMMNP